jgi:predicted DNA-binding transcriptional regulator AlpA
MMLRRNQALGVNAMHDLLDRRAVCALLGGSRPINAATLYRNIAKGLFPRPIKVGAGSSRWVKDEVLAALVASKAVRP